MDHLGQKIATIREQHKVSQTALAKELGISRSALYRYEIGERTPDMNFLTSFAKRFAISLDDLVFGDISVSPASIEEENEKTTPMDPTEQLRVALENVLDKPVTTEQTTSFLQAFKSLRGE